MKLVYEKPEAIIREMTREQYLVLCAQVQKGEKPDQSAASDSLDIRCCEEE